MNTLQLHEEAIRSRVCVECIYPSGSGICGTGQSEQCPLNVLLPRAIEAVNKGKSKTILDYLLSLRVAKGSPNGSAAGLVSPDEAQWLKRSLPLIVAAVEEADEKLSRSEQRAAKTGT